ncbi:hypothetical protein TcasGA2_TC005064 [Tribolium castaneum]|uniref:Uncharacterized protein n=1 Tax=Tribolium castaneum TaxID=7070 RepID=D7EK10_TRICA|nr:hypothetical protein TcasGA2_TC005064 [Tribolium castaneum]
MAALYPLGLSVRRKGRGIIANQIIKIDVVADLLENRRIYNRWNAKGEGLTHPGITNDFSGETAKRGARPHRGADRGLEEGPGAPEAGVPVSLPRKSTPPFLKDQPPSLDTKPEITGDKGGLGPTWQLGPPCEGVLHCLTGSREGFPKTPAQKRDVPEY